MMGIFKQSKLIMDRQSGEIKIQTNQNYEQIGKET